LLDAALLGGGEILPLTDLTGAVLAALFPEGKTFEERAILFVAAFFTDFFGGGATAGVLPAPGVGAGTLDFAVDRVFEL
jgi:hypothetical protein